MQSQPPNVRSRSRSPAEPLRAMPVAASRGMVTWMMLVFIMVIAMVFSASFLIGRTIVRRNELQTAADAMARASAITAQLEGSGEARNVNELLPLVARNVQGTLSRAPSLVVASNPAGTELGVSVRLDSKVFSPASTMTGDLSNLDTFATSNVAVRQSVLNSVTRNIPKMVLVLDYSGSMGSGFGGGHSRIEALRASVRALLNLGLEVHWGLVIFGNGIHDTVGISDHSEGAIRSALGQSADGSCTATGDGLREAGRMLRATGRKGRYILLVSDGYPNCGSDWTSQADALRTNDDVSIYTLEIKSAGSGLEAVMKRLAGPKGDPDGNDADYFYSAANEATLVNTFQTVVANILCQAGPLEPRPTVGPGGSVHLYAFLRDRATGAETRIPVSYEPASGMVKITNPVHCDAILDRTHELVLRYDRPVLAH